VRLRPLATHRFAAVSLCLGVTGALSACGAADQVQDRAAQEAFCAQWRAITEVGSRLDDPAVRDAVTAGAEQLRGLVPEEQQQALDEVIARAGDLATAADGAAGGTDEQAVADAQAAFDDAFGSVQESCEGSLFG
jgi:hypothetical protein